MITVNRDYVPLFDRLGIKACSDTIMKLKSLPKAPFHDHPIQSTTYKSVLQEEIEDYLKMSREW
ncbi:MAG: hypothetical protein Tsb0015_09230 [Simkaniaceae bacterium]